jgi:hypothetical protein
VVAPATTLLGGPSEAGPGSNGARAPPGSARAFVTGGDLSGAREVTAPRHRRKTSLPSLRERKSVRSSSHGTGRSPFCTPLHRSAHRNRGEQPCEKSDPREYGRPASD